MIQCEECTLRAECSRSVIALGPMLCDRARRVRKPTSPRADSVPSRIMRLAQERGRVTRADAERELGIHEVSAREALARLVREGRLLRGSRHGGGRRTVYLLAGVNL